MTRRSRSTDAGLCAVAHHVLNGGVRCRGRWVEASRRTRRSTARAAPVRTALSGDSTARVETGGGCRGPGRRIRRPAAGGGPDRPAGPEARAWGWEPWGRVGGWSWPSRAERRRGWSAGYLRTRAHRHGAPRETARALRVAIGHPVAMTRIVLPRSPVGTEAMAVPIPVIPAPPRRDDDDTRAEGQPPCSQDPAGTYTSWGSDGTMLIPCSFTSPAGAKCRYGAAARVMRRPGEQAHALRHVAQNERAAHSPPPPGVEPARLQEQRRPAGAGARHAPPGRRAGP
jgi:hypothetical protein